MKKEETEIRKSHVREFIESLVVALMLALVVTSFVVQSFEIPSGSMLPTLLLGDRILVNKFIFGTRVPFTDIKLFPLREPMRGEIVVFIPPVGFESPVGRDTHLIKRVVGLPGDTLEIIDKRLFVNGREFVVPNAHWDDPGVISNRSSLRDNFGPIAVGPHSYFMMGDNRDNSYDSRFWGFARAEELTGKPIVIYWSWDITAGSVLKRLHTIRWERIGNIFHQNGEIGRQLLTEPLYAGRPYDKR
jgi:signal peptidase I